MYSRRNFKTKKAFKEAVAAWNRYESLRATGPGSVGAVLASKEFPYPPEPVRIFQPGDLFRGDGPLNETEFVEGPHYPAPHTWYAEVSLKPGTDIVIKVR